MEKADMEKITENQQTAQDVPASPGAARQEDGGSAFPYTWWDVNGAGDVAPCGGEPGATLRDYFAAKALPALISTGNRGEILSEDYAAKMAYEYADAMLQARKVVAK
jgi:hypothetical protein